MRLFLLVLLSTGLMRPQESPSGGSAKSLLIEVRNKVMDSVSRLPKYLCTETLDRTTFEPQLSLETRSCDDLASRTKKADRKLHKHTTDRVRLEVAISADGEMYSWVGADHFENLPLADLVHGGATSTGVFVSFLASIFGSNAATFTYNGDVPSPEGPLAEFGFRVPLDKSHYRIGNKRHHAIVAYEGKFLANAETFDLVQLTIHADQLPPDLQACETSTTLDYVKIKLNDAEFLIPGKALWRIVAFDGTEFESRMVFSACHEFHAESKLSFDEHEETQPSADQKKASGDFMLSPELFFSVAFANAIKTATAAAGDPLKGKLTTAIRDKRTGVVIPKGTAVTGRIVQIERLYGSPESLTVALRLETIEVNGVSQPFHAVVESVVKRRQKPGTGLVAREDLGSFDRMFDPDDPSIGFLFFEDVSKEFVIQSGLELEGKTIAPK